MKRSKKESELNYQIEMVFEVPRGYSVTKELYESIVLNWVKSGDLPDFVSVRYVDWQSTTPSGEYAGKPVEPEEIEEVRQKLLSRFRTEPRIKVSVLGQG